VATKLKTHHSKLNPRARSAWTAGRLIQEGARRFRRARLAYGHGTANPHDEAAWLALHALKLPLSANPASLARSVSPRAARRVLDLFDRRIRSRKPAGYLTREAWLGGLSFYVDERVIVPRSHIADLLLERLSPWAAARQVRTALDLCTGSGCLAILLARAFPRSRVDAADISRPALAVARINVARHRLKRRVRLVRSDLFSALNGRAYDLIVCNPPYVTGTAMRRLPQEYRHEPRIALAGGRDGLDDVRAILRGAAAHLRPGGSLVMEVGDGRARVERAFPRVAFTWADAPGGGDVLVLGREELTREELAR
jgi:ribosomal protein L3 glutamine methyltransferase